jgi:hypothetical protein
MGVIEYDGLGRIARRVSSLVLLRYLELCVAVGVEGDGDEIRPAAYCTVLGVDLPRATTGIHEGVVLLAAERARVGHGFSGYRKESGDKSDVAARFERFSPVPTGSPGVAVREGARVFSAYELRDGARIWIITEADRSVTTILLPEEY